MALKHVHRIRPLDNHLSLLWIKYSLKFSVPCWKTPTDLFTSVLVLIMRISLFLNVRTSSLINSVHQISFHFHFFALCCLFKRWIKLCDNLLCCAIYGRQWLAWILNYLFFSLVYYVRFVCSFILFILLNFLLPHVWWNKLVYTG